MPLFSQPGMKKSKGEILLGRFQKPTCPRCNNELREVRFETKGEGIHRRLIEAEYACSCEYKVEIIESYPLIRAVPEED